MDTEHPDLETASIIFVGSFNPKIFQPQWFTNQGLISETEGADADITVLNNDICLFSIDWCRIEVIDQRAAFTATAPPTMDILRDLAVGTFKILRHAPIRMLGLNTMTHFRLPSKDTLDRFGHLVAPKDKAWSPVLSKPGMLSLRIQGERPDDHEGHIQVKISASHTVQNGLCIDTNDEYRSPDSTTACWATKIIQNDWHSYRQRAHEIQQHLLRVALDKS